MRLFALHSSERLAEGHYKIHPHDRQTRRLVGDAGLVYCGANRVPDSVEISSGIRWWVLRELCEILASEGWKCAPKPS